MTWKCHLGSHRFISWKWQYQGWRIPVQFRRCTECGWRQGPLTSSEERRYYESWRDRR